MSTVNGKAYRFPRALLIGLGLVAVLSFLAAIGVSKLYWGYYTRPPSLDKRIREIGRVISLTAVGSERQSDSSIGFVARDAYSIAEALSRCRGKPPRTFYGCLSERILVALGDLGKLPASADRMPPEELATLYGQLEATGLLRDGGPGYDHARELKVMSLYSCKSGRREVEWLGHQATIRPKGQKGTSRHEENTTKPKDSPEDQRGDPERGGDRR